MNDITNSVAPTHDDTPADPPATQPTSESGAAAGNGGGWLSEDELQDSGLGADSELLGLLGQC